MNKSSTFSTMPLSDGMKQTIKSLGYISPTPIQEKSIPELLLGKDLLGQAQTGTGKTAAFSIPLVELVDEKANHVQALVVCPTRELCLQVRQEIERLSICKNGLESIAVYGGQAIEQQFRALKSAAPQIIVATPGRLFDHLRRGSITLSKVKMIILDEADEMLDMGFRPEIEQIFDLLPEENQRIFFSATMPKAINDLACSYLRDPEIIKTESKTLTVSTIQQSYIKIRGREKTELLCRMLDYKDPKLAVVFCNAKSTVDEIADDIGERGFKAGVLHGDLSQNQRDRVMAKFRAGMVRVLVATDVAARGLDIDDVELVLNYHLPHDPEDYVHRIGRTGRAGRSGCAVSLVEPRDNSRLRRISHFAKIEIAEELPPTIADIKSAKLNALLEEVKNLTPLKNINEYRSAIAKQKISVEDLAAGMLQIALKKFDEQRSDDKVFNELREKKYTDHASEKRFRNSSDRNRKGIRSSSHSRRNNSDGPRRNDEWETSDSKKRLPKNSDYRKREKESNFSRDKAVTKESSRKPGRFPRESSKETFPRENRKSMYDSSRRKSKPGDDNARREQTTNFHSSTSERTDSFRSKSPKLRPQKTIKNKKRS